MTNLLGNINMVRLQDDYLADYQYNWLHTETVRYWGITVDKVDLVSLNPMNMSDLSPSFVSNVFANSGIPIEQLIEGEQYVYVAALDVNIDLNSTIHVNGGQDRITKEVFIRWLSEVTQVAAWDYGIMRSYGASSRNRIAWLMRGLMYGLTRSPESTHDVSHYAPILEYFKEHPFGSEPAVMSLFSLLPTFDRIATLEQLDPYTSNALRYYEKVSMAYVKHGRADLGYQALNQGWRLDLLTDEVYERLQLKIKHIESMPRNSSTSYDQAVMRILGAEGHEMKPHCEDFYHLLLGFAREQAEAPPF